MRYSNNIFLLLFFFHNYRCKKIDKIKFYINKKWIILKFSLGLNLCMRIRVLDNSTMKIYFNTKNVEDPLPCLDLNLEIILLYLYPTYIIISRFHVDWKIRNLSLSLFMAERANLIKAIIIIQFDLIYKMSWNFPGLKRS